MKIFIPSEINLKSEKKKLLLFLIFLFTFLILTLCIDFFHTETSLLSKDFCPACNFHSSSLATGQINFFSLPQLSFIAIVKTFEFFNYNQVYIIDPASRSPPYNPL